MLDCTGAKVTLLVLREDPEGVVAVGLAVV